MSYTYMENLGSEDRDRYAVKLTAVGIEICPYKIQADSWINDPLKWSSVMYGDIYNYLIESPGVYTSDKMKSFKSLDAYRYFEAGWVQTVLIFKPTMSSNTLFRAKVLPSQRVADEPHNPWVAVDEHGAVITAHCDCMAGLGESCSHIAALLFKVEAAVRLGFTDISCTSQAWKWNEVFTKKVCSAPISEIVFHKDSYGLKKKKMGMKVAEPTETEINDFLSELAKCSPYSVVLSAYDGYCAPFVEPDPETTTLENYPIDITTLYCEDLSDNAISEKSEAALKKIFDVTDEQRKNVAKATAAQSSSLLWYKYRAGRITSSTAHALFKTSIEKPSASSILNITLLSNTDKLKNIPAIKHGRENEKNGITGCVNFMKETFHSNVKYEKIGLTISQTHKFIAASPDFVLTCDCCGKWVGEVKCPYTFKDIDVENINAPGFYLENGRLNPNHSYYTQVQLQMHCLGIPKCLFVIWTNKSCCVTRVDVDREFLFTILNDLSKKYEKFIIPEIISRRLESQSGSAIIKKENSVSYCICSGEETEEMIGCDNPECTTGNQWFHFSCLKIKRPPKGKWYCPTCRKQKKKN